jgi:hypothetical protein
VPFGLPDRQSCFRPLKPARVPSGGWSGSEEPSRPPGGSDRFAASGESVSLAGHKPSVPSGTTIRPAETEPSLAPFGPRQFGQRLRATRNICGSPSLFTRNLQGVFSNAAAGIAVASTGLNFSISIRGLLLQECSTVHVVVTRVRIQARQGWCFIGHSGGPESPPSQCPSYATHVGPKPNTIRKPFRQHPRACHLVHPRASGRRRPHAELCSTHSRDDRGHGDRARRTLTLLAGVLGRNRGGRLPEL